MRTGRPHCPRSQDLIRFFDLIRFCTKNPIKRAHAINKPTSTTDAACPLLLERAWHAFNTRLSTCMILSVLPTLRTEIKNPKSIHNFSKLYARSSQLCPSQAQHPIASESLDETTNYRVTAHSADINKWRSHQIVSDEYQYETLFIGNADQTPIKIKDFITISLSS